MRVLPEREVTAINEQLGWGIFYKHNSCENPSDWRPVAWHRRWNGAEVPEWYSFADEKVGNNPTNVPTERVGASTTLSWLVNLKTNQKLWVKMDCNPTRDVAAAVKNDWNFPAANCFFSNKRPLLYFYVFVRKMGSPWHENLLNHPVWGALPFLENSKKWACLKIVLYPPSVHLTMDMQYSSR